MNKKSKTFKKAVAALVPAFNEDGVIKNTLKSLLKLLPKDDIYVVDDGSSDETSKTARKYTDNVISTQNHGKAHALNFGINYYSLTKRYKFIFFMDADTMPKEDFLEKTLKHFKNYRKDNVICVVGRVKGKSINWISKYRQWEYQISYQVHKRAQEYLNSIIVVPGCATVYRSFIFDRLEFPQGTLTEDMDFTFLMHRSGYERMVFEKDAIVYTQDPLTLKDFIKQLNRWYTGFWQVVRKHDIPWRGQMLDLEVTMLALEGLYNGLIVLFFIMSLIPLSIVGGLKVFSIPLMVDLFIFFIPTLIWSAISDRDPLRLTLIPHFYFLRFLSSIIFIKSFFIGFTSPEKEYVWDSNRYLES